VLQEHFQSWTERLADFYGDTAARRFGALLDVPGITPQDFRMSFQPYQNGNYPHLKGIDVADIAKAIATGAEFDGSENYLDTPAMRDYLARALLKPGLAQKFYRASRNLPPLVKEVNKRLRTAQTAHRKKTGNDLYL
jgi:hypothetical protein